MIDDFIIFFERNGAVLFAVAAMLLACLVFYGYQKSRRIKLEAPGWPKAQGIISLSEVQVETSSTSTADSQKGVSTGSRISEASSPRVVFEYTVQGQRYTSDQIGVSSSSMSVAQCQEVLDRYPVGQEVVVYYMPGNPHWGLLDPDYDPADGKFLLLLASIFMGVGLVILLVKLL